MIKINQFYWELYRFSENGKKVIDSFQQASSGTLTPEKAVDLFQLFDPEEFLNASTEEIRQNFYYCFSYPPSYISELLNADTDSIKNVSKELTSNLSIDDCNDFFAYIAPISFYLFSKRPDYFLPYLFLMRYKYLQQIIEDYDIDIDEVPGRASKQKRCYFYFSFCEAFYQFRLLNNLSVAELCAVLYDMERLSYDSHFKEESKSFPKVWLIGGSKKNEKEAYDKTLFWQSNSKTKAGDIMLFYENKDTWDRTKKSSLTGIWTALTDGASDPLSFFYGSACIGNEIKIKPIPFSVLTTDDRTNKLPRAGANFTGISGDAVSSKLYEGVLSLIRERDPEFDLSALPKLHEPYHAKVRFEDRGDMKPEKWVEEYLIKEMLEQMGWGRFNVDYRRQVPLQLGREKKENETIQRGRTDFSLFPYGNKLKCADVLIEAKAPGEMDGNDIEKTFWQAESYASRQYASLIILADGDKILLFPRKREFFSFSNNPETYTWNEIFEDKDKFNKLRDSIAKHCKHKHH